MALILWSLVLFAFSAGVGGECEEEEDDDVEGVEVSVDGVAVSPRLADVVGVAFSDGPPFTESPDVIPSATCVVVEVIFLIDTTYTVNFKLQKGYVFYF